MSMKLWGGRFATSSDQLFEQFSSSLGFDQRLLEADVVGSKAFASALEKVDILSSDERDCIRTACDEILKESQAPNYFDNVDDEDIHTFVIRKLAEKVGELAEKIHTGRSRNEQVATDLRIWLREEIRDDRVRLTEIMQALLSFARREPSAVLPGYTHLRRAQPVLWAHYLLAYFEMFGRDVKRFKQVKDNADVMPLGSGAIAGVPYHIDRDWVAEYLGFESISRNSMDAVSDRDFLVEYQAASALCMMHLSRLGEELIFWSSDEFKFARLDDEHTTGSSMMPQKRNPDFAEIARGKTGRVYGNLMSILTVLKGLPLAYNRDMQEDKEGFFDTIDTILLTTNVFKGMISKMQIYPDRMRDAARGSYLLATDVADYLVDKGIPFREAHSIVADLSSYALSEGKHFDELSLDVYRRFSDVFDMDVFEITVDTSVADRDVVGGTAFGRVSIAVGAAKEELDAERNENV